MHPYSHVWDLLRKTSSEQNINIYLYIHTYIYICQTKLYISSAKQAFKSVHQRAIVGFAGLAFLFIFFPAVIHLQQASFVEKRLIVPSLKRCIYHIGLESTKYWPYTTSFQHHLSSLISVFSQDQTCQD